MNAEIFPHTRAKSEPTAIPEIACFKISQRIIRKLIRPDERVLAAGRLRTDFSVIMIGAPIWFNRMKDYLVASDRRLVLGRKTLWRRLREVRSSWYDEMKDLTLSVKKKQLIHMRAKDVYSIVGIRMIRHHLEELKTVNHPLVAAIAEKIGDYVTLNVEQSADC